MLQHAVRASVLTSPLDQLLPVLDPGRTDQGIPPQPSPGHDEELAGPSFGSADRGDVDMSVETSRLPPPVVAVCCALECVVYFIPVWK